MRVRCTPCVLCTRLQHLWIGMSYYVLRAMCVPIRLDCASPSVLSVCLSVLFHVCTTVLIIQCMLLLGLRGNAVSIYIYIYIQYIQNNNGIIYRTYEVYYTCSWEEATVVSYLSFRMSWQLYFRIGYILTAIIIIADWSRKPTRAFFFVGGGGGTPLLYPYILRFWHPFICCSETTVVLIFIGSSVEPVTVHDWYHKWYYKLYY